ncbi:increased DNA methylation [Trifolium repens]|jgi:hypothetical protein|nr:increased DNA methylation [Trifolium repens]
METTNQNLETDTFKMQQQRRRSQFVVNGYFVYTRQKRIEHDSDNEKVKRLRTEENEQVKVTIGEAVKNDVVLWTSKRQRRPSFKLKVESEDDGSGDKVVACVVNTKKSVAFNEKLMSVKELLLCCCVFVR